MELELRQNIECVGKICGLIENEQEYGGEMMNYLPVLRQTVNGILVCAQDPEQGFVLDQQFVLQVMQDIVYGMEHNDPVILLDVLKYGLLQIYYYVMEELRAEG